MTDENDSAYPITYATHSTGGLTKREYFAALAMQGALSAGLMVGIEERSAFAVEHADALIEALNKESK